MKFFKGFAKQAGSMYDAFAKSTLNAFGGNTPPKPPPPPPPVQNVAAGGKTIAQRIGWP